MSYKEGNTTTKDRRPHGHCHLKNRSAEQDGIGPMVLQFQCAVFGCSGDPSDSLPSKRNEGMGDVYPTKLRIH